MEAEGLKRLQVTEGSPSYYLTTFSETKGKKPPRGSTNKKNRQERVKRGPI